MRYRQVRHRLHFGCLKYSQGGLSPMKSEQRIMIATDVFRRSSPSDRAVEHPAKRWPIHCACVYAEANNLTCVLIHYDEHPMAIENKGFATEQIDAPEPVFRVTEYPLATRVHMPRDRDDSALPAHAVPRPFQSQGGTQNKVVVRFGGSPSADCASWFRLSVVSDIILVSLAGFCRVWESTVRVVSKAMPRR